MRTIVIAALLAFAAAGAGHAADDSLDKSAKKTSDGFGELLKGMGQEIQKTGIVGEPKKEDKKEDKKAGKPSDDKAKDDSKPR